MLPSVRSENMRLGRAGEDDSRLRQADERKQYSRSEYNKASVVGE